MKTVESYGWVDDFDGEHVKGWFASQRMPLQIEIIVNSNSVGKFTCGVHRPDIQNALHKQSFGAGFDIPLAVNEPALVDVRCANTQVSLNGSPFLYTPTTSLSLKELADIKDLSQHLSYDVDALMEALVELGIVKNEELLAETKKTVQVSPLYSCKKKITGLVWSFPTLGTKIVQLNKRSKESAHIQALHRRIHNQGDLGQTFKIPRLLGVITLQRHGTEKQVMRALLYQCIDTVHCNETDHEEQRSLDMIRALLELHQVDDDCLRRRQSFKFSRRLSDLAKVFMNKERFPEKISTLQLLIRFWRLPRVFSHGDAHQDNFIFEAHSKDLYLVDWSHYGYLPLGFDIAWLIKDKDVHSANSLVRKALRVYDQRDSNDIQLSILLNLFYLRHVQRSGKMSEKKKLKKILFKRRK